MSQYLKIVLISFGIFILIDGLWLTLIARKFYAAQLGGLMATNVRWLPAIVFYVVFILGLGYFVILPAAQAGDWTKALLSGLFFGLVTYATYDLTNLATIVGWPWQVTVIDLLWGTTLGGLVSTATFLLTK